MSKSNNLESLELRPANDGDRDFLRAVFASTRETELAFLAGNPAQAEAFIGLQFQVQQQNYRARYPSAENMIILSHDQPIGRILVSREPDQLVLVDIAIQRDWRNQGIGSLLISKLMSEAAEQKKPVILSVYKLNPALRLYQRLGFSVTRDDGMYLEMSCAGE